jgi:hypothetical protein
MIAMSVISAWRRRGCLGELRIYACVPVNPRKPPCDNPLEATFSGAGFLFLKNKIHATVFACRVNNPQRVPHAQWGYLNPPERSKIWKPSKFIWMRW